MRKKVLVANVGSIAKRVKKRIKLEIPTITNSQRMRHAFHILQFVKRWCESTVI